MTDFGAWLWVVVWAYYALDRMIEDNIGQLIAGQKSACQCSTVGCDDQNLLCSTMSAVSHRIRRELDLLSMYA